ncbi:MAG: hypothetical protein A3F73_06375 [Gallionellales bacterium RIFCSPLOWO2_12_FULL_59_22]|nr:MAG: hypothetical protein A3F73_06375 [Gallionellales bacterium RIFCSPLOWO2_12_FULL_59_22]
MRDNCADPARHPLPWLALAVLLAYLNAFSGSFQFDDYKVIVDNPAVHSWDAWFAELGHGIRPLLKFSYTFDWTLGLGIAGFHLTNLLIHLTNVWLVLRLCETFIPNNPLANSTRLPLCKRGRACEGAEGDFCFRATSKSPLTPLFASWATNRPSLPTPIQRGEYPATTQFMANGQSGFIEQQLLRERLRAVPLFAALLFAVHPAHTEAVTYICGRSASLMTLFYLGGLLAYAEGRIRENNFMLYMATPLLFVLALSVKETAVTFPLALLIWELCLRKRRGAWKTAFKAQWTSWAVLLCGALYFLFNDSYLSQMERSAEFNAPQGNLATQLTAFAWLMRQWALPLWLNIDPDLPLLRDLSESLLPLVFFGSIFALMLACWRKRPWLGFALAWAILHLLPLHLFLPRLDIANERQLYLAGWPLFLALAAELALRLDARSFRIACIALLFALGSLTLLRNQVYVDEIALWEDTARKSPHKARVHNNLGYAYKLAGRTGDARREFILALRLDPKHAKARHNIDQMEKAP